MKKSYPSRKKSRWEHALTRPLSPHLKFELIELMRIDLFEFLDALTTSPYTDAASCASTNKDIQRVAARLKELTPHRAKALRAALKAGRIEYVYLPDLDTVHDRPPTDPMWHEAQEYWQNVQQ